MALIIRECQRRWHLLNVDAVLLVFCSSCRAIRPHFPTIARLCSFDSLSYKVSLISERDSDYKDRSWRNPYFEAYRMSLCHLFIVALDT